MTREKILMAIEARLIITRRRAREFEDVQRGADALDHAADLDAIQKLVVQFTSEETRGEEIRQARIRLEDLPIGSVILDMQRMRERSVTWQDHPTPEALQGDLLRWSIELDGVVDQVESVISGLAWQTS